LFFIAVPTIDAEPPAEQKTFITLWLNNFKHKPMMDMQHYVLKYSGHGSQP
jgi:hypothetical protein